MEMTPTDTYSIELESWIESANDSNTSFPIQNLPFGRFRMASNEAWSACIAIGDYVLDLYRAGLTSDPDISTILSYGPRQRIALRQSISLGLRKHSKQRSLFSKAIFRQNDVELGTPCEIRNYSDFFVGIHHAFNTGALYRPENPLLPNYYWVPIGYHARATTVLASDQDFKRPLGQILPDGSEKPILNPTEKLDFELEMGVIIGRGNDNMPIPISSAEEHIFGLTLLNDWSARDIQRWEAQPLGPFLSKSFATTISPWIVTMEALAPYRRPLSRDTGTINLLPYLDSIATRNSGAFDIQLEVWIQTAKMRSMGVSGDCIVKSNFASAAYWTIAQMVTQHTINGCSLLVGDLLGTGTLSLNEKRGAGCLLEITEGGKTQIQLSSGETRTFLEDGDSITLRGYCDREGFRRIGFGECRATICANRALHN